MLKHKGFFDLCLVLVDHRILAVHFVLVLFYLLYPPAFVRLLLVLVHHLYSPWLVELLRRTTAEIHSVKHKPFYC